MHVINACSDLSNTTERDVHEVLYISGDTYELYR